LKYAINGVKLIHEGVAEPEPYDQNLMTALHLQASLPDIIIIIITLTPRGTVGPRPQGQAVPLHLYALACLPSV
jgi:hypothetical protein